MDAGGLDTKTLNLYQKLAHITGEIGSIRKGGTNKEQGYAFIEYAAVAGELRGLFAKYGVVIVPRMQRADKQSRDEVTTARGGKGLHVLIDFYFDVINADKPEEHFVVQWSGEATDYGDKATNKAATSALKYYLMRQFNVSEKGEQEADAVSHEIEDIAPVTPPAPKASSTNKPSEKQLNLIAILSEQKGKDDEWLKLAMSKIHTAADASTMIEKLKELEDA